jgi:hypothetical protein
MPCQPEQATLPKAHRWFPSHCIVPHCYPHGVLPTPFPSRWLPTYGSNLSPFWGMGLSLHSCGHCRRPPLPLHPGIQHLSPGNTPIPDSNTPLSDPLGPPVPCP